MTNDLKTITILFRAVHRMESLIKADVSRYGLNPTEFGALEALYHKGPLPVQAIIDKVLIANSSMTYVLTSLQKKQWIQKEQDSTDRRIHTISLTEEGKHFMDEIYPKHVASLRKVLDQLAPTEEQTLQELLKTVGKASIS
jgi:MarR family transcriptional regulator, 2-MHQ and catechol-resistance regulon repressor